MLSAVQQREVGDRWGNGQAGGVCGNLGILNWQGEERQPERMSAAGPGEVVVDAQGKAEREGFIFFLPHIILLLY